MWDNSSERVLQEQMAENRRLIPPRRPWLPEFPRIRPSVNEERPGVLGFIVSLIEIVVYIIAVAVIACTGMAGVILIGLSLSNPAHLLLLAVIPMPVVGVLMVAFRRQWIVLEPAHPRRTAALLSLLAGTAIVGAGWIAWIALYVTSTG